MRKIRRMLLLLGFALVGLAANAQTILDPAFATPHAYAPSNVEQALQLSDGARLLVSDGARLLVRSYAFERINGVAANGVTLYKFNAAGQPDAAFNTQADNYAARGFRATWVREYPGNKLMVALAVPFRLAGQTYNSLVRLNSNGTVDASFTSAFPFYLFAYNRPFAVQPDGKVLLSSLDAQPMGTPRRALVRLLADGTLDLPFLAQLGTSLPSTSEVAGIHLQVDGKMVITGTIFVSSSSNVVRTRLLRLLPSGLEDATFNPAFRYAAALAVQPDGKILIARDIANTAGQILTSQLMRLLPGGGVDATFASPSNMVGGVLVAVQPDGRILVASTFALGQVLPDNYHVANNFLLRLLPTGTIDASFQVPSYGDYLAAPTSLQVLPTGQILVASSPKIYASATAVPTGVAVLDATGAYQSTFVPVVEQPGVVNSVAVQPDGKIVVGGNFTEINGVAVRNVARFSSSGTLDASFSTACAATGGNETVAQVMVQANGKILLVGGFAAVGGQPLIGVARLLSSGQPDAGFAPGLAANSVQNVTEVSSLAVQPDGQLLAGGYALYSPTGAGQPRVLMRLSTAGALDASFQPPLISQGGLDTNLHPAVPLLVQPDGRILAADVNYQVSATSTVSQPIIRLLANGTLDTSFLPPAPTATAGGGIFGMERYADGRLLVYGDLYRFDGTTSFTNRSVAQLQANGLLNPAFSAQLYTGLCFAAVIQPNQRILAVGQFNRTSQSGPDWHPLRLLPMGALDTSFNTAQLLDYYVGSLALQADGGILIGGAFINPLTGNYTILARLLDPNVLTVAPTQAAARTEAYPVPAHDALHLHLDLAARPQQVQLLDAVGRAVLTQAVAAPDITLNTAHLPAGGYLLRVQYAGQTITRRVVLE